ncbi:uncharacterized protein LOC100906210 [Galendromus occidentalis]|uniref:Uncharacterized protein LOC100906210 n=1 Tax=Galendromus occidentalis TaxID=34638 RepID=A0AAJ7L5Y1_9ACAR|nr:uncharacterized protein LOC100906210 [Galendromus occidentalis]
MRRTSRSVQNRVLRKRLRQFYNEQLKSRKFDRSRNEEECVKTLATLEQTLLAMRCHLEMGHDLLAVYGCLGATHIGGGFTAKSVLPVLDVYRTEVNDLLKKVMFDGSRQALTDLQGEVDAVRNDLTKFAGQVMVLPLSLELFTDTKVRDCRVVIDYGGKLTTIHGTHFSGRCSRILLGMHPESEPKISLAYRKSVMGIFIKEKSLVRPSTIG